MNRFWRWCKGLVIALLFSAGLLWVINAMLIPHGVAQMLEGLPPAARAIGELCYAEGDGQWFYTLEERYGTKVMGDALLALLAVPEDTIANCAASYAVKMGEIRAVPILVKAAANPASHISGAAGYLEKLRKRLKK
ncbi:MAG: hypothetical protein Q7R35_04990 [Elusimicrobiota bacterium]|nr:hypothetical protein [Elusimicrobiota bacterium]